MSARHEFPILTRDVGAEAWRMPTLAEGATRIFAEPGRVLDLKARGGNYDVCYRSHAFAVDALPRDDYRVTVKHGGGEESVKVRREFVQALHGMTSDARYFVLYELMDSRATHARAAAERVRGEWSQAFADGRLKKRKQRGTNSVRVWIEPKN